MTGRTSDRKPPMNGPIRRAMRWVESKRPFIACMWSGDGASFGTLA